MSNESQAVVLKINVSFKWTALGPSGAPGVDVAQAVAVLGSDKEFVSVTLLGMEELRVLASTMRWSTASLPTVMVMPHDNIKMSLREGLKKKLGKSMVFCQTRGGGLRG